MGWVSGSSLLVSVWATVRESIPVPARARLLILVMKLFEDSDCDTICESGGGEWTEWEVAYRILHPDEEGN